MDYYEIRTLLTEEELGFPEFGNFIQKAIEWIKLAKEDGGGRKTRSANRKVDTLYEELMSWNIPPIKLQPLPWTFANGVSKEETESEKSVSSRDSSTSRPVTRSLRPRSRTPVATTITNNNNNHNTTSCPSTPSNQRIRSRNIQATPQSGVLSAALNQQHPSVSVTKIRQLLRADSAQKKREEEKERQERLLHERQVKEERAEAKKRQLLEERAINAKLKREQRLNHAAEIRKAKVQEAKQKQQHKHEEEIAKLAQNQNNHQVSNNNHHNHNNHNGKSNNNPVQQEKEKKEKEKKDREKEKPQAQVEETADKANETFQKPEVDNIQISIQNETADSVKEQKSSTAAWARAPHLRNALIEQFSKSDAERLEEVFKLFPPVELPINLEIIFGRGDAGNICRTSSAVWSPPNTNLKRTSSMSQTPTYAKKH